MVCIRNKDGSISCERKIEYKIVGGINMTDWILNNWFKKLVYIIGWIQILGIFITIGLIILVWLSMVIGVYVR